MSMIVHHRRKLAYTLGCKADTRQFIPFSKNTNTDRGRKVFIDAALAPLFAHAFQSDEASALQMTSKIEQLGALGGNVNANQNTGTPFEYMENIGKLAVYYQIHQGSKDNQTPAGVYITGVQRSSEEGIDQAGLYQSFEGRSSEVNTYIAEREQGFIKSHTNAIEAADMLQTLAGNDGWGTPNSFNFFYIPATIENEMGLWMTPDSRAMRPTVVAKEFASVLTETQKHRSNSKPIKWQIEGDTVKLLQLAIEHLPNLLDKHHFMLTDPVADTAQIVNALERRGAKTEGKFTDNRRALAAAKVSSEGSSSNSGLKKALANAGANSNTALSNYNTSTGKIKSSFIEYVKNLTGTLAW
ncbi:MAG: hypothetical protein VYB48_09135 [Pseudomonadota bacterium]|nr:hypothetical protein [Pseudomonadota bacterium]MEC8104698.1 hypothetical protein [Pseudomonadota bacterium]MEC8525447.1 hypothetical protein [Pseudomonadota bacterium]